VAKELLPIVATPALRRIGDECVGAGIERLVVVSSAAKPSLDAYARTFDDLEVVVVHQDQPRGLGHAVNCAAAAVGDEPFAVLLPDEIMGSADLLQRMIAVAGQRVGSVVGLMRVPMAEVSAYGVVQPAAEVVDGVLGIASMIEKPAIADAPSDLIVIGRYVLTPDVFAVLEQLQPGAKGEIQLTDALAVQARDGRLSGVLMEIDRHDTGTPLGWLTTNVELALRDRDLGPALRAWLAQHLDATS
jgi:UTP--glucose-1-phosphate uridylyltransferase